MTDRGNRDPIEVLKSWNQSELAISIATPDKSHQFFDRVRIASIQGQTVEFKPVHHGEELSLEFPPGISAIYSDRGITAGPVNDGLKELPTIVIVYGLERTVRIYQRKD